MYSCNAVLIPWRQLEEKVDTALMSVLMYEQSVSSWLAYLSINTVPDEECFSSDS